VLYESRIHAEAHVAAWHQRASWRPPVPRHTGQVVPRSPGVFRGFGVATRRGYRRHREGAPALCRSHP
jgi:hypothetical protein